MKKTVKLISILLFVAMISISLTTVVSAKVCKIKADGKGTTRIDAAKAVWVHNKKNNINISK